MNMSRVQEFLKYGIASAIALGADMGTLSFLYRVVHLHPNQAATAGFCVGVLITWYLSVKWVFAARVVEDPRREFLIFAGIGLIGLLLTNLVIWFGHKIGLAPELAKLAATGITFIFNFGARKLLLFAPERVQS